MAWHVVFAQWIIKELKPRIFVELGTHNGDSYFSFCQAVKDHTLKTKCHAVDSWKGEPHAGFYSEDVYTNVNKYNQENYKDFSTLHRCLFDEAVNDFKNKSIDLLHIDGFHTYEAVKHDFETWLPKLSSNSIILFHDTAEVQKNFGVWRFWEELEVEYPDTHFMFLHSHGLGVLGLGDEYPEGIYSLFQSKGEQIQYFRNLFSRLNTHMIEPVEKKEISSRKIKKFNLYIDTGSGYSEKEKESTAFIETKGRITFFFTPAYWNSKTAY